MLVRWWQAFVTLLDTKEAGTCLAIFRIIMALAIVIELSIIWMSEVHLFIWVDLSDTGYQRVEPWYGLIKWLGGATAANINAVVLLAIGFSCASVVGLGGRVTHFILLQLMIGLVSQLNPDTGGGYDMLIKNGLWLMVLAPTTRTLSLDCYLRTRRWTDNTDVAAWVRYVGIFQILMMYLTSGLQKVSADWVPGGGFSALYYILQQPSFQRFDGQWLAWVYPLTQLGTAVTWFWQLLIPVAALAYWYRYTADRPGKMRALFNKYDVRLWFVSIGAIFHLGILLTMTVGPFPLSSLAFYIFFFTPGEVSGALLYMKKRIGLASEISVIDQSESAPKR